MPPTNKNKLQSLQDKNIKERGVRFHSKDLDSIILYLETHTITKQESERATDGKRENKNYVGKKREQE